MSSPLTPGFRERRVSVRWLIAAGSAIALAAALAGAIVELWRFGFTQSASAARLERQVRRDFEQMTTVLTQVAVGVAMDPEAARALSGGSDPARDLFKLLDRRLANNGVGAGICRPEKHGAHRAAVSACVCAP